MRARGGKMDADIVFVGSDNPDAYGLQRARNGEIPTFVVNYRQAIRSFRENRGGVQLPADFRLDEIRAKQGLLAKVHRPGKGGRFSGMPGRGRVHAARTPSGLTPSTCSCWPASCAT